jgi:single-stranded DNA-specific DHH superfamily exonuclease
MIGDARMFNSINKNDSNGYDSIVFCDNGKGKVKGLALVKLANKLETPILRKHNKH